MSGLDRVAFRQRVIHAVIAAGDIYRRVLGVAFAAAGPRFAYAFSAALGRMMYALLPALRERSEAQAAAALGMGSGRPPGRPAAEQAPAGGHAAEQEPGRYSPAEIRRIAAESWVQRVWNLADLPLAERLLHPGTYERYGGRVPEPHRSELLDAQRRRRPAILLSAYYGPYDLLPLLLGLNGIRAAALYRRHANAAFDAYRQRVRARGGCELVPVERALERLPRVLDAGGMVALIADHHAGRRGLPATFLGLPTTALPTVGILAARHQADIVVAGIRRIARSFRFEIVVIDVIRPADWAGAADPLPVITARYLRGLERLVLGDPSQYLWAYARWGEELARELTV